MCLKNFKWVPFCIASIAMANEPSEEKVVQSPHPMRVSVKHIEGKGIGYPDGYTSLTGFFAPDPEALPVLPFVDLRGHVFNNGKMAANAGFGLRGLLGSWVLGGNAYYDYRNTKRQHYNQIGIGLEALDPKWEVRFNGYLPVGKKTSTPYDTEKSLAFDSFTGNSLNIQQTVTHKIQYAMKGVEVEFGYHFLPYKDFDVFLAGGPYYYGFKAEHAVGGKARLAVKIYDYLTLEGINSYDSRFHEIVQGLVSVNIPFGPRSNVTKSKKFNRSSSPYLLNQRMVQDVARQEIIVADHRQETVQRISTAINPLTGKPFAFVFVDNTSHSAGTFESPYPTLADAQNNSATHDVIYVFSGDLSSTGLSAGIVLKDYQKLWGSPVSHTLTTSLGSVMIPALTSGQTYVDIEPVIMLALSPVITNTSGSNVVTAASNNEISGVYIQNLTGHGITAISVDNLSVSNCIIQGPSQGESSVYGVNLDNVSGTVTIDSNLIYQGVVGLNITATGIQNASYTISKNDAPAIAIVSSASYGNFMVGSFSNCENLSMTMAQNSFTVSTTPINMTFNNTVEGLAACVVLLDDNSIASDSANSGNSLIFTLSNYANVDLSLTNNTLDIPYGNALSITQTGHSKLNLSMDNNDFDSWFSSVGIALSNEAALTGYMTNNAFIFDALSGISITATDASAIPSFLIADNEIAGALETYYLASDAISIAMTSGATASVVISSNNVQAGASNIDLSVASGSTMTASITDNIFTHPQLYGLTLQTDDSGSVGNWTVSSNIFVASGANFGANPIGAVSVAATAGSTTNLSFNDNLAAPIYPLPTSSTGTYQFANTGSTFNITSYSGNTGARTGP